MLNHEIALTVLSLPDAPKAEILASADAGESLALLISFSNFTPASCAAFLRPWTYLGKKAVDLSVFDVQPDDRVVKLPLAVAAGPLDDFVALFVDTQIDSFSVG